MGESLSEVAKNWLTDPSWQKVFKHTTDVLEDYVSYILVAVGTVALSVRLLSTLGTGDLVCVIMGVEVAGNKTIDLGPYPSGGTLGLLTYAQTEEACIRSVFTPFMEYLPYVMLLQTLILVVVEKFTFRIPRIAQKVERFYKNIVEESLFGKDPDVAEDMYDSSASTDAISRRRQRNEICVTLKRSSIIHHVYIGKNICEIILVCLYLPVNISYAMVPRDSSARCGVHMKSFPGVVDEPGIVHFQCHGKKLTFVMLALWAHIVLLAMHGLFSMVAIVWCLFFRSVTNLLKTIEAMRKEGSKTLSMSGYNDDDGEDFLFLFDLLAHSCGLESTLRVLTHSDTKFYEICKPNMDLSGSLILEEDKLKVIWKPADIEVWLQSGKKSHSQKAIVIDSYEVTIFPAESVKHTHTLTALTKNNNNNLNDEDDAEKNSLEKDAVYSTWFFDLNGGRTEYVLTIACMIGKSRMKGEKVVTNLVPYGAEKPRSGMVKTASTHQVEIFWDPPKGEFTRYILHVDKVMDRKPAQETSLLRLNSGRSSPLDSNEDLLGTFQNLPQSTMRIMDNLSYKLTTYTILGLEPGEKYRIELFTKTGNVTTRQSIQDIILTCPMPPRAVRVSDVTASSCVVSWLPPNGHPCLRGYLLQIRTGDGKIFKDVAVTKASKSFLVRSLSSCQDYDIFVTALCLAEDGRKTESEPSSVTVTTLPEKIKNLHLENATPNSLSIAWDVVVATLNLKYKLVVSGDTGADEDGADHDDDLDPDEDEEDLVVKPTTNMKEYSNTIEVPGDKTTYTISRLPDIIGSGHGYNITICAVSITAKENEVTGQAVSELFMTKPLPPSHLVLGKELELVWHRSITPSVKSYKIKWKPIAGKDTEEFLASSLKADEATVRANTHQHTIHYTFAPSQVQVGVAYKINIYAVAECGQATSDSKEMHEKIVVKSLTELAIYSEDKD